MDAPLIKLRQRQKPSPAQVPLRPADGHRSFAGAASTMLIAASWALASACSNSSAPPFPMPAPTPDAGHATVPIDGGRPVVRDAGTTVRPDGGSADASSGPCRSGEMPFGESCYRVLTTGDMIHSAATTACSGQGGTLVRIDSAAENDFVFGIIPASIDVAWIGLERTASGADTFAWADGDAPSFVHWAAPDEPNNDGGSEDCVVMWGPALGFAELRGYWNDAPCSTPPRPATICERPQMP